MISAEKDFCPVLGEPSVIYGDQESELLKIVRNGEHDIFIEGVHCTWTLDYLEKKLHTKLYREIPFSLILVRSLRKLETTRLLCLNVHAVQILSEAFGKISADCFVPLELDFPRKENCEPGMERLGEVVERASEELKRSGHTVTGRDTLPIHSSETEDAIPNDTGLVASQWRGPPKRMPWSFNGFTM